MKRSRQLIETIKERQIQPIPRWRFLLKRGLWVVAFALAVILGGLAFSVILLAIQQADFSVLTHMSHSRLEFFLAILPFVWLGGMVEFSAVAVFTLRRAPRGYKLTWSRLMGYSLVLSIVVGALYFMAGGAQQLEAAFASRAAWYESLQERKVRIWSDPTAGLLSGSIIDKRGEETLTLRDFAQQRWTIDYDGAFIPPIVDLSIGDTIKLVGAVTAEGQFQADEVRPWRGYGLRGRGPRYRGGR
ncbi:MAG: hypothetical protein KDC54_00270 [Lewinella sp.]|nr:hypothetical protein [Lewinella sp.]